MTKLSLRNNQDPPEFACAADEPSTNGKRSKPLVSVDWMTTWTSNLFKYKFTKSLRAIRGWNVILEELYDMMP